MPADLEGAGEVDRRGEPLISIDDLSKIFRQHNVNVHALGGVSAAI